MKKCIKKLVYSSFIAFISIGISFNAEARVTREVAEATLPYLMEAVGIPEDIGPRNQNGSPYYLHDKIQAILKMIYTDGGQQQMVNWAQNGVFPPMLTGAGFATNNLYLDAWLELALIQTAQQPNINQEQDIQNIAAVLRNVLLTPTLLTATRDVRNASIGALFPCGPGTFSSYATHISRLGYHALNANTEDICSAVISNRVEILNFTPETREVIERLRQYYEIIDNKLANVLFVLDICDSADQIKNILNQTMGENPARDNEIDVIVNHVTYNEYDHRPVSATSIAQGQRRNGDCGETLYRHLINIAIQNDVNNPKNFNIGHLPVQIQQNYYNVLYPNGDVITIPKTHSEAGRMRLPSHDAWKTALRTVQHIGNITNTSIGDISRVLNTLRIALQGASSLRQRHPIQGPFMQLSQTAGIITNQYSNSIQEALNALDGRGDISLNEARFLVGTINQPNQRNFQDLNLPHLTWITDLVEIVDRLWNRRIIIGCSAQHAEIASIQ